MKTTPNGPGLNAPRPHLWRPMTARQELEEEYGRISAGRGGGGGPAVLPTVLLLVLCMYRVAVTFSLVNDLTTERNLNPV